MIVSPIEPPTMTPVQERTGFLHRTWYLFFASLVTTIAAIIGRTTTTELTLAAASTTVDAPTSATVDEWLVVLKQDGTGGRAITWGTGIIAASTSLGTAAANSYSVFLFKKSGSNWFQVGQQTTDMT